jgi:hypothetical protein
MNPPTVRPTLDERFAQHSQVRQRLVALADLLDQTLAEGCTAHEAEARTQEQLRRLGQELLTAWAAQAEAAACRQAREAQPQLQPYRKKNG